MQRSKFTIIKTQGELDINLRQIVSYSVKLQGHSKTSWINYRFSCHWLEAKWLQKIFKGFIIFDMLKKILLPIEFDMHLKTLKKDWYSCLSLMLPLRKEGLRSSKYDRLSACL